MGRRRSSVLVAAGLLVGLVPVSASAQQLVYLVRHAERADQAAPAGQMQAPNDPPLSPAGEARAKRLATMLRDAGITAIFTTQFRRTRDTAQPLASARGLTPLVNPGADTAGLVAKLRAEHATGIVLVVGHSNTIPEIIAALGGPAITIADNEYDNLFVLVPTAGALARIRY